MFGLTNFLGGLWIKLLILGGIILSVLVVVLRIQSDAKKAGKLAEQAEQRMRNEKIRKLQEQDRRYHQLDIRNINTLLDQL